MSAKVSGSGQRRIAKIVAQTRIPRVRKVSTLQRHRDMRRALRAGIKGEVHA